MNNILPKLVIFDWDGTLANTRPLVVSAIEKTLSHFNQPSWDRVKKTKRDGAKSFKENFPNFFADQAEGAYAYYLKTYLNDFSGLEETKGASTFLSFLSDQGVLLGIVSNKEKQLLIKEVQYLFSDVSFVQILGNGDTEYNKPHPSPILSVIRTQKVDPLSVWMIGDSKQDTDAAYGAGCHPVLIGKGLFMDQDYIQAKCQVTPSLQLFKDFDSLLKKCQSD